MSFSRSQDYGVWAMLCGRRRLTVSLSYFTCQLKYYKVKQDKQFFTRKRELCWLEWNFVKLLNLLLNYFKHINFIILILIKAAKHSKQYYMLDVINHVTVESNTTNQITYRCGTEKII